MKYTNSELKDKANTFLELQRSNNAQQECWHILSTLAVFFRCSPEDIQREIAKLADMEVYLVKTKS